MSRTDVIATAARGGIRMLPVIDSHGESTARRVLVCSVLLIPISLAPHFLGMTGGLYIAGAITAGLGLLYFSARMARKRSLASAHALLLATILYLPLLLGIMVLDRKSVQPSVNRNSISVSRAYTNDSTNHAQLRASSKSWTSTSGLLASLGILSERSKQ